MPTGRTVYILRSRTNPKRHYVGSTHSLRTRVAEHNEGAVASSRSGQPWNLHAAFWFADSYTASRFESYLKSGSGRAFAKRHF